MCGCGHIHGCVYDFARWNHFSYYLLKSDVVTTPSIVVTEAATVVYSTEHFSRPLLLSAHTVSQESCTANSHLSSEVTVGLSVSTFFERSDGLTCANKLIYKSDRIVVRYAYINCIHLITRVHVWPHAKQNGKKRNKEKKDKKGKKKKANRGKEEEGMRPEARKTDES